MKIIYITIIRSNEIHSPMNQLLTTNQFSSSRLLDFTYPIFHSLMKRLQTSREIIITKFRVQKQNWNNTRCRSREDFGTIINQDIPRSISRRRRKTDTAGQDGNLNGNFQPDYTLWNYPWPHFHPPGHTNAALFSLRSFARIINNTRYFLCEPHASHL